LLGVAGTILAGSTGAAYLLWADPTGEGGPPLPSCPSKALFGIVCPGCGSARMVYSLLHLDLSAALRYNALALLALPFLLWLWLAWAVGRWRGHSLPTWQRWRWAGPVAWTLIVVWGIVRNIPVAPFTLLRV